MRSRNVQILITVILPLAVGIGVIAWLFSGPLSMADRFETVTVEGLDHVARAATVRADDGSVRLVPTSAVIRKQPPDSDSSLVFAVGDRVELVSHGLVSMAARLPWWVPLAVVGLLFGALLLQVWRIWVLMQAAGNPVSFGVAFRAFFAGLFYGNIIPAGQVGGDPIKALVLSKRGHAPLSAAISAVAVDRGLGLLVLAVIALVSLSVQVNDPRYGDMIWWVGGFVTLSALCVLLLMSRRVRRVSGLSWAAGRFGPRRAAGFLEALRAFRNHPTKLVAAGFLSLVAQLMLIGAAISVGAGLSVDQIGIGDYLALVPPANVVSALPAAAPGGWGVGEGAFVFLFGEVGVAAEAAFMISAVPRLGIAVLSLLGLWSAFGRRLRDDSVAREACKHDAVSTEMHSIARAVVK